MKKLMSYMGNYKKYTLAAFVLLLLGTIASVLPFYFLYQILEPLISGVDERAWYYIIRIAIIGVLELCYVIFYVKGLSLSHISAFQTLKNIRVSLQKKIEKQPLGVIHGYGVGSLKKMFINDIDDLELLLAHALPEGLANLTVPISVLIAIFVVDWKLGLLSLLVLPIGMFAMGMLFQQGSSKMDAYYKSAQKMNNTIVEYINGMEVVKVFNKDGESLNRYEDDVKAYRNFTLDWYKACWPWMAVYNSILPCVCFFTLPFGAYFVMKGYVSMSDLTLVLCMSFGIGGPLLKALNFGSVIPQINYKIEALEKMSDAPQLKQNMDGFKGVDHSIDLSHVCFGYSNQEVIHDVSLHINEGDFVAFVGESGSGKSTLAKLLVHFYDINKGSITIGGQDITNMSLEALNNEISYVSQEQFLFNTTLMENIRIGKLDASDEEVIEACRKTQCFAFLDRLPDGLQSMAGDSGKLLSGGERQRISLARAILKDAPIVVLDEATAFIDPENEEKMNLAIREVIKNKTVIVIAHKLQSIIHADKICVLHKGAIVACGTHEDLLRTNKEYANLWQIQEQSIQWTIQNKEVIDHA